jgi:cytidyltransferase-like protein
MKDIVIVTGGFDPLHSGHIKYLAAARKLGDQLIVGVNSDPWLIRKKGRAFMPWSERADIIGNLRMVDAVIEFDDWDNSARHAIRTVRNQYPQAHIIFANGGDRTNENIPEMDIDDDLLEFRFGVGGTDKANSSSWILEEWKSPRTYRSWGHYRILYENDSNTKVKELVVEPGQQLSMQRHEHRTELWYVAQGTASIFSLDENEERYHVTDVRPYQNHMIFQHRWHQLANLGDQPLKIVEIQYGERCEEEDIERR